MDKKTTIERPEETVIISTVRLPGKSLSGYRYETCVFINPDENDRFSEVQDRYPTYKDADTGHERYVEAVERGEYTIEDDGTFPHIHVEA